MDYNESRLDYFYIRYVLDTQDPPRDVITTGPLKSDKFREFVEKTRDPDCPITIISVVSILKYPYDHKGISDRSKMIRKQK